MCIYGGLKMARFTLGYVVAMLYSDFDEICHDFSKIQRLDTLKILDESDVKEYMDLFGLPFNYFKSHFDVFGYASGRVVTSQAMLITLQSDRLLKRGALDKNRTCN